ncbi:hypothetical protein F5X68DRAFT_219350 [Plectosphaerella plurivora]|uniref:FAD dependent oxidoreductase domain-containing protein n=1 Tax=Plectosphaerella plurivora TaxID=936078 RepID=A0A9P8VM14_9PEZI|nr:hypothetical protein F5X68DRAFT_219350 [Plectosphaerella plurivora]
MAHQSNHFALPSVAPQTSRPIVIVGAGIIGLDTALVLCQRGLGPEITIVAEHFPGDNSVKYVSPLAGANFSAISGNDDNALRWDRLGYQHLIKQASQYGRQSWIKRTPSVEYWDEGVSQDKLDSISAYLEDFKVIPISELPEGVAVGVSFTTVTINAPKHIEWLHSLLKTEYGVQFARARLPSIHAACVGPDVKLVFNCTGNGAKTLGGVSDARCYPTRGQILLARVPHVDTNIMRHGRDYVTYVIPRPWSNGNAILGGYLQKGNDCTDTFLDASKSILKRTEALSAQIGGGPEPEILATIAGLRPSREGGARVERAQLVVDGARRVLVHNYGAGGTGYQAGYGMSLDAVATVEDVLAAWPAATTRL